MAIPVMLHVCCGPCAAYCAGYLTEKGYAVTLCFANSNIHPVTEYRRRLRGAMTLAGRLSLPLVEARYDHEKWLKAVSGLEDQPEGGARCRLCFAHNLVETSKVAVGRGIGHFTTSLTVSPHKSNRMVFSVGRCIEGFLAFDFKRGNGFRESVRLSGKFELYRQKYCGCEFSLRRQHVRDA